MAIKVAGILSEHQLVLNVGTNDGLSRGDRFVIFEPGDVILDPDTGENLGRVERIKAEVEVTHVQERIATVESVIMIAEDPAVLSEVMARTDSVRSGRSPLHIQPGSSSGAGRRRPIAVGDRARQVDRV